MPAAPCRQSSTRSRKALGDADSVRWRRSWAAPRCRPSSTCSATCSPRSIFWSSAAAWPTPSWPRRAMPWANRCASTNSCRHRARDHGQGEGQRPRDRAAGRCRGGQEFAANAPSRVVAVDSVAADEMILDIGPRSIEHVCSVLGPGEDAGLERAVRGLRARAVRHRHGRGRGSRGGTHGRRKACNGRRRRRYGRGAQRAPAWPTGLPTSRPPAAPSSNGWRARPCPGSRCSGQNDGRSFRVITPLPTARRGGKLDARSQTRRRRR